MMNGEGTCETPSEVTSVDPLDAYVQWRSRNSDDSNVSPISSQYSSCGESEFERYCSANSVMGTPSVCSSVGTFRDFLDSEVGIARSSDFDLENISLGGKFNRKYEDRKLSLSGGSYGLESVAGESSHGPRRSLEQGQEISTKKNGINPFVSRNKNWSQENTYVDSGSDLRQVVDFSTALDEGLSDDEEGGIPGWRDLRESSVRQNSMVNMSTLAATTDVEATEETMSRIAVNNDSNILAKFEEETHSQTVTGKVENSSHDLNSHSTKKHTMEPGGYSDEDKASSRYDNSEGEESMFGYGTEDEQKIESYHQKNIQYPHELETEKRNSVFMNSSVAFGSDDWDDFMLETEKTDGLDNFLEMKQVDIETKRNLITSTPGSFVGLPGASELEPVVQENSVASNHVQCADELAERTKTCSMTPINFLDVTEVQQGEDVKGIINTNNQVRYVGPAVKNFQTSSISDMLEKRQEPLSQAALLKKNLADGSLEMMHPFLNKKLLINTNASGEIEKSKSQLDPLSNTIASQLCSASTGECNIRGTGKDSPFSVNLVEDHLKPNKTGNNEINEFYNEVVHEMEEILLDSGESSGAMFSPANRIYQSQIRLPLRDGGPTASTSGTEYAYSPIERPMRIDGVEVVGAKQKKGDASFGERLVGVKEYTVYIIRVFSGKDHWEVERRYRDFCTLYRRLKTLFADEGRVLPSPWSSVERESRKVFGNVSPNVIAERSSLIQDCLRSILSRFPSSLPNALVWFLSPPISLTSSATSNSLVPQFPISSRDRDTVNLTMLGKTISLILDIRPQKSMKQILESQHCTCAGCHKHFDDGTTRIWEFVQTLGWGKPRFCEYTSQLFCSSCHTNEVAVLPAKVLHLWDFNQYPVSQMAKSYLDSIHDQPMLCVSAVNPFLFSKVPPLQHVTSVRKKIGAMLPYVRCSFRRTIHQALGSRKYLLESNDFFALRDLIDLSKAAFAALPVMVDTVSKRILEHITEQCLVCCDVGIPCNARRTCDDPSSLIFPFQEGEIERCRSCELVFHKHCYKKIVSCPCGVRLKPDGDAKRGTYSAGENEVHGMLDYFGRKSASSSSSSSSSSLMSVGFLSGLFSNAKQPLGRKADSDTVILMGSLPNTSL